MNNNYLLIIALFGLLVGCATETVPATNIYTLSPRWSKQWSNKHETQQRKQKTQHQTVKNTGHIVLKLAPVNATRLYNNTSIIYINTRYSRNSYAYSRWSDAPVILLQAVFQQALEKSRLFAAVLPPASISKARLILESTLFDFSQHITDKQHSSGVISIRFYLVNNVTRQVIKSRQFMATAPAPTNNAQGAVMALNKAATIISHQLVQWLDQAE